MDEAFDLRCDVTVRLMPRYLDDDLPERQVVRLEQHIMICDGCHTYLGQLRRTIGAVSGLRSDGLRRQAWAEIAARLPGSSGPAGTVVAYKFLSCDCISPFAQVRWPEPGAGWVFASADVGACRRAVHACRALDLAYWLGKRLWRVELAGEIAETQSKIAAGRGRLLDAVDGWPDSAGDFIQDCKTRLEQLQSQAQEQGDFRAVGFLKKYAGEIKDDSNPASVSYTTAHAKGIVGWTAEEAPTARARGERTPFDSERRRQSHWLADRLGLTP